MKENVKEYKRRFHSSYVHTVAPASSYVSLPNIYIWLPCYPTKQPSSFFNKRTNFDLLAETDFSSYNTFHLRISNTICFVKKIREQRMKIGFDKKFMLFEKLMSVSLRSSRILFCFRCKNIDDNSVGKNSTWNNYIWIPKSGNLHFK